MTKATGFGPLPDILEQHASSKAVHLAFQSAGLPFEIIEYPETRVPLEAMQNLFEFSARAACDRCFGFSVGQKMSPASFGLWLLYCAQAPTLEIALQRSVKCGHFHQSGGWLTFESSPPVSIWRYATQPGLASSTVHHTDHLILPMLRFIQLFLGPDWLPEWVELNYPRDRQAHLLEAQLSFPIRFGAKSFGIAIRHSNLATNTGATPTADRTITLTELQANETVKQFVEPVASVSSVISMRLLEGMTGIEGAAQTLDTGVQQLQRDLRAEGTTYRTLLETAKQNRAQALLTDTNLPVTEIAFSLGYSDHANFTRAFKRLVGIAPANYREVWSTKGNPPIINGGQP